MPDRAAEFYAYAKTPRATIVTESAGVRWAK
jgi:hypothetical protein